MKTNLLKSFVIIAVGLLAAMNVWADYDPCNIAPANPQDVGTSTATFSWSTADNGDVVVTIVPGEGTTTAAFRQNGFTGNVDQFKVLSGDGFTIEENASKYFYEKENVNGKTTYTLYRTGNYNLPSPCKIKYNHGAIEWKTTVGETTYGNAYDNTSDYVYEYGTLCGSTLDAPEISINSTTGVVTFADVEGADSYRAYVYYGSTFVKSFTVTSGQKVFTPYLAGEYSICVKALNSSNGAYSNMTYVLWDAPANALGDLPVSSNNPALVPENGSSDYNIHVTWDTDEMTGNLLITLSAVDPAKESTTSWRSNGLNINDFQYNGESFTEYFDRISGSGKTLIFGPKTGASIPTKGGIISYTGNVQWNCGTNINAYKLNFTFKDYYYGSSTGTLLRPIINSLSNAGVISFDAVPDATSYKAYVYNSDKVKVHEQIITNGGTIDYHPYLTGTYEVYLQALGEDDAYSAFSASLDWSLTGSPAYLPQSEWCETLYETNGENQSEDVNITWVTDAVGNMIVTLSPVEGNTQTTTTEFRDYGMSINKFTIGEEAATTYFDRETSGATLKLLLKDPSVKPSYGTTIHFNGQLLYKTGTHTNAYPSVSLSYVYGSTCNGYNDHVAPVVSDFSVVETDVHSVTFHVSATDEDDLGTARAIASYKISSEDNDFATTSVTPNGDGNFTVGGLVSNGVYTFTIQVIDAIGNVGSVNISDTKLPLDPNFNIAKGKDAVAGAVQAGYPANQGCDGNNGTMWSSYTGNDRSKDWWYVDLGAIYKVRQVSIKWMNDNAVRFLIQGVNTLPANEDIADDNAWTTYLDYTYAADPEQVKQDHVVVGKMRYLRLKALQNADPNGINFYELEVYGSDYAELDNVAPVIGTKECTTDSEHSSVTFTLTATDAVDGAIKDFYISCANPAVAEAKYTTNNDNQITITGLDNTKDYTFDIRFRDLSGNWASTSVIAHFAMAFGTNVAEGKTATAGSTEGENFASYAVDGNKDDNHRWGNYGQVAEGNNWWKVDLGNAFKLTTIAITWQTAPDGGCVIEGSLNDDSYTQITFYNGNEYNTRVRQVLEITGEQATIPYRYIRVRANTQTHFMSFYEFEVYASEEIALLSFGDAADNNSDLVSAHHGETANVVLNRTILADNTWYTLCLPFDMDADKVNEVFGLSKIAELKSSEERGSLIHLNFDYVNAIKAGKPYLIKVGTAFAAGTSISGVTIKNVDPSVTPQKAECTHMYFQGTFDAITLNESNQRFVADDDYLYSPAEGGTDMGAFRCYFTISASAPAGAPGKAAKIVFAEETITGMENVEQQAAPAKFILNGVLYILRDGKTYNAQGLIIQ